VFKHLISIAVLITLASFWMTKEIYAEDWPTFGHDNQRSHVTLDRLDLPLNQVWEYVSSNPPLPAWPAPAKQDFWHNKRDLNPRVIFDRAFHVAVVGERIFFASSADGKVYCLDGNSGQERWSFFTDGPIRLAPSVYDGKVYAGSDDGYIYCLDAFDGHLIWKQRLSGNKRYIIGNGRMISIAPVRSGIIIFDKKLYAGAGLFPKESVKLAALDTDTGRILWDLFHDISPQGYMLASKERLYIPTGRTSPGVVDINNGKWLGTVKGSAGAYALVTDDMLVYGPGDTGTLSATSAETQDHLASFDGLHMIVQDKISYLHSKVQLSALNRVLYLSLVQKKKHLSNLATELKKKIEKPDVDLKEGEEQQQFHSELEKIEEQIADCTMAMPECILWEVACNFPYSMILAGDHLFTGGDNSIAAFSVKDGSLLWKAEVPGRAYGMAAANGRLYVSTDQGRILCFGSTLSREIKESARNNDPFAGDESGKHYTEAAAWIIERSKQRQGYCLVLGCNDGKLAYEIARSTKMKVIGIEKDRRKVDAARIALDKAGLYGTRVNVFEGSLRDLAFPDYFANLIVSDRTLTLGEMPPSFHDIFRLLRPCGGTLLIGQTPHFQATSKAFGKEFESWIDEAGRRDLKVIEENGYWSYIHRQALPESGEWTHMYADVGNTACSMDRLVKGELELQWFGQPGPRMMIDRHHRNVPPLYKSGRLFVPGDNCVLALDAYNGTWLWDLYVSDSRRLGIFLDASNLVVDEKHLFMAHHDQCDAIDVASGRVEKTYKMPRLNKEEKSVWGYLARYEGLIIGTGCLDGASYTETSYDADNALWHDNMAIVTSSNLFGLDCGTGDVCWTYNSGLLINPTITVGGGRIYFVETHSEKALNHPLGRMPGHLFLEKDHNYLTSLDIATGKILYRKNIDLTHCRMIAYLNYATEILVLSGCEYVNNKLWYFFYGISAGTGKGIWQQSHDSEYNPDGGHGEQNRHPTIVGDTIYTYPYAYELKTGRLHKEYKFTREGHGCGGISASAYSLFWRGGNPTMRDLRSGGGIHKLNHVSRPGCWINIIPAGGMVLIPEASSGCTCAFPLQTSMAYRPVGETHE